MNWDSLIPPLAVLSSLIPGIWIFVLSEEQVRTRTVLNLGGAFLKLALIGLMMWGVFYENRYELRLPMLPGLDLVLRADALALLFGSLSAVLWLFTTIYAIAYLEGSPNRSRFFGFFSLCVSGTIGIALAGNLFTFLIFYEMLTLATYPLVVHRGTAAALRAGRVYLAYTLGGGAVLLLAVVWLYTLVGPIEFDEGVSLAKFGQQYRAMLIAIFALLIAGLGVKTALVPLHGWLPVAMVAPAPVSALLHAVAVVKAGAFGIVRVVYDVYGSWFSQQLGVASLLAVLAGITIVYGSVRALFQDDLKRRLAFSTVSQVSYIVLGVAVAGPAATTGGVVHLVHQGLMKITLFFCAGNVAETLGLHRISELAGVGRRMPWTMGAFTVAAFGMIGVPPLAGFVTKWYLGVGALDAAQPWVIAVLAASTLLNAAYFLPVLHVVWFQPRDGTWPRPTTHTPAFLNGRHETHWALLMPPLVTALLVVAVGLFAASPLSPLHWVKLIVERAYSR
jgi:multicomponent Na+:H+ antiporter subunit D